MTLASILLLKLRFYFSPVSHIYSSHLKHFFISQAPTAITYSKTPSLLTWENEIDKYLYVSTHIQIWLHRQVYVNSSTVLGHWDRLREDQRKYLETN